MPTPATKCSLCGHTGHYGNPVNKYSDPDDGLTTYKPFMLHEMCVGSHLSAAGPGASIALIENNQSKYTSVG